ncbi:hypothetical protein GGS24DRAFT_344758 [Hypoxylon argillaceum]|nr:hypothetical protein GGS24DRAFT_344758 [Hypoxylon argillaceum]
MSENPPLETCINEVSHSEDEVSIKLEGEGQESDIVNTETPLVISASPPPDNIQGGSSSGSNGLGISPSDDAEDSTHIDADQSSRYSSPTRGAGSIELVPQLGEVPISDPMSTTTSHGAPAIHGLDKKDSVTYDMQLVHVPRPSHHRLSLHARAETEQAWKDRPLPPPPPPPLNLFKPSGIAYLNGEGTTIQCSITFCLFGSIPNAAITTTKSA